MMNVLHWNPFSPSADLINDDTTPTGGDMGAHVWGPAFLRDHLLPNWQLSGWSMDWYGGLPVYRFYMVIPALAIVALDALPCFTYGVAFKYVVIAGGVSLPLVCWAFGRLARFRYPMPELFAFGALCFLFNESIGNHLLGGNVLADVRRRVLVLARAELHGSRLGPARPRARGRQVPLVGRHRPRAGLPVPRHRADLHRHRRGRHRRLPSRRRRLERAAGRRSGAAAPSCRRRAVYALAVGLLTLLLVRVLGRAVRASTTTT